jgi:RNA polymerase sigma-70 factor (ECF subfamily)
MSYPVAFLWLPDSGVWVSALAFLLVAGVALRRGHDDPGDDDSEDLELLQRARSGDRAAFNRLIRKYQTRVYNFCFRMVRDVEDAEELTQDVFVKLFANLKRFRAEAKFSTWLFQIAKNLSLNKLQYLKRRKHYAHTSLDEPKRSLDEELGSDLADDADDAEAQVTGHETRQLIHDKIDDLREEYRIPLILRDIEGLSYDEIAKAMNLAEGTVKSRIHKARLELKNSLDGFWE